jgi:hypothetical protein
MLAGQAPKVIGLDLSSQVCCLVSRTGGWHAGCGGLSKCSKAVSGVPSGTSILANPKAAAKRYASDMTRGAKAQPECCNGRQ